MRFRSAVVALVLCTAALQCVAARVDQADPATIADVTVRSQDDQPLRFYSDVVKGRIVAVNFIFTSCRTVCPLMGVRFAQTQSLLSDKSADVTLVSISIDPVNDTPARLAAWSAKMGAKPGWTLVTGAKSDIDALVKSLGSSAVDPTSHSPLIVIIDDLHGGPWQRLDGLTDPATLARILRSHAEQAQKQ